MSHFGSFIPKDIIMDHDSSRKISLYSSLQPYRTIFIPAPKDVFLQFCVLTCCIWYTSILLWLPVQILLAESRDRTEKGRYLQSVCIHYTKVKIMSKKYTYFQGGLDLVKRQLSTQLGALPGNIYMKRHKFKRTIRIVLRDHKGKTVWGGDNSEHF